MLLIMELLLMLTYTAICIAIFKIFNEKEFIGGAVL